MRPLPRPSVSPLHSFASRPDVVARYVSFAETVRQIVAWLTGRPKPTARERQLEALAVGRLAAEMEAEDERPKGER